MKSSVPVARWSESFTTVRKLQLASAIICVSYLLPRRFIRMAMKAVSRSSGMVMLLR